MQEMDKATPYEPAPRCWHAAVSIENNLHLWGGYSGSKKSSKKLAGTAELFNVLTELWEKKTTVGIPPPGLWFTAHTAIGTSLYNFGGYDGTSLYNSRLHQLNTDDWGWKELLARNPSSGPIHKEGSGMVALDEERLLIFAGYTGSDYTNELHMFNILEGKYCQPPICG